MFDWDLTSDEWIDVANEALGINLHTPGIEVLFVLPGSPADMAGLRPGDRVIRLGEWRVPSKRGAFTEFYQKLRSLSAKKASSIDLRIQREARFVDVTLYPVAGCDFPIVLREDESMGAFSDGEKVMINRGMLRFTRNDDELAMVITHEVAHNVLDHIDIKRKNALQGATVGVVVDILLAAATGFRTDAFQQVGASIGALAYSKDFEMEADYYSAYLMALAGFDISGIPAYWRYLGSVDQKQLEYNLTHPTSVERSVNMRKTVEEIEHKRRAGHPLRPDH
jgi:Zn-dependent protease with chaperone function